MMEKSRGARKGPQEVGSPVPHLTSHPPLRSSGEGAATEMGGQWAGEGLQAGQLHRKSPLVCKSPTCLVLPFLPWSTGSS